eukprot:358172-Chlamydomonas_euryale.AAC.1
MLKTEPGHACRTDRDEYKSAVAAARREISTSRAFHLREYIIWSRLSRAREYSVSEAAAAAYPELRVCNEPLPPGAGPLTGPGVGPGAAAAAELGAEAAVAEAGAAVEAAAPVAAAPVAVAVGPVAAE